MTHDTVTHQSFYPPVPSLGLDTCYCRTAINLSNEIVFFCVPIGCDKSQSIIYGMTELILVIHVVDLYTSVGPAFL